MRRAGGAGAPAQHRTGGAHHGHLPQPPPAGGDAGRPDRADGRRLPAWRRTGAEPGIDEWHRSHRYGVGHHDGAGRHAAGNGAGGGRRGGLSVSARFGRARQLHHRRQPGHQCGRQPRHQVRHDARAGARHRSGAGRRQHHRRHPQHDQEQYRLRLAQPADRQRRHPGRDHARRAALAAQAACRVDRLLRLAQLRSGNHPAVARAGDAAGGRVGLRGDVARLPRFRHLAHAGTARAAGRAPRLLRAIGEQRRRSGAPGRGL